MREGIAEAALGQPLRAEVPAFGGESLEDSSHASGESAYDVSGSIQKHGLDSPSLPEPGTVERGGQHHVGAHLQEFPLEHTPQTRREARFAREEEARLARDAIRESAKNPQNDSADDSEEAYPALPSRADETSRDEPVTAGPAVDGAIEPELDTALDPTLEAIENPFADRLHAEQWPTAEAIVEDITDLHMRVGAAGLYRVAVSVRAPGRGTQLHLTEVLIAPTALSRWSPGTLLEARVNPEDPRRIVLG